MSDASLVDYYADTLILQYIGKPKAYATVQAFVDALMIFDLIKDVENGYDVLTAVGVQLDILGKYAGIARSITGFNGTLSYFGYLLYSETPPKTGIGGYSTYGETGVITRFLRYVDTNLTVYTMTDAQYQLMITLKIFKNYSDASLENIDTIMEGIFGNNYLVVDNGDMFLRYSFGAANALLVSIARFVGLIPAPTGVGLDVTVVPDIDNIFAFKQYGVSAPSYVVGFKEYGVAKAGGMAAYG